MPRHIAAQHRHQHHDEPAATPRDDVEYFDESELRQSLNSDDEDTKPKPAVKKPVSPKDKKGGSGSAGVAASKEQPTGEAWEKFVSQVNEDVEKSTKAAKMMQRSAYKMLRSHCLNREQLIARLELEATLLRHLCMILVYLLLFFVMCFGDWVGTPPGQLQLNDFYTNEFGLGDVGDIVSPDGFKEYLNGVSETSQKLTPSSSMYFEDKEEVKIIGEAHEYHHPHLIQIDALSVKVDMMEFSFTAWVNAPEHAEGYIVRKPLDISGHAYVDSCWGWYHSLNQRWDFAAHDFGGLHTAAEQESVSVDASHAHYEPGWHLETIIVRQDKVEFWENDHILQIVDIKRPVTDCSGNTYEVGGSHLNLAMLIFYPYALQGYEIHEIFEQGASLKHIAQGMQQYHPQETEFDLIHERYQQEMINAQARGQDKIMLSKISNVVTREVAEIMLGEAHPATYIHAMVENMVKDCAHSPACRFINGVEESLQEDPITNKSFYDLLPISLDGYSTWKFYGRRLETSSSTAVESTESSSSSAVSAESSSSSHGSSSSASSTSSSSHGSSSSASSSQGSSSGGHYEAKEGARYLIHLERDRHAYNASQFPTNIGTEYSFSWWAKPYVAGGFIIGKFKDTTHDYPCWAIYMSSDQVELHSMDHGHKVVLAKVSLIGDSMGGRSLDDYALTEGPILRHMLVTVSESTRKMKFYLDGFLVGYGKFKYDDVKTLECPNEAHPYVAFMHRTPGSQDMLGEFQQLRLYAGSELSAMEARALQLNSVDPNTGAKLRECSYTGEVLDDPLFLDEEQRSCRWYAGATDIVENVCSSARIIAACPNACRKVLPCFLPPPAEVEVDVVWDRVMHVMPPGDMAGGASHRRLAGGGSASSSAGGAAGVKNFAVCLAEHVDATAGSHSSGSHTSSSPSTAASQASSPSPTESSHSSGRRLGGGSAASSQGSGGGHGSGGHPEPVVPMVSTDHTAIVQRCKQLANEGHSDYHLTEEERMNLKITDGFLYLQDHYPSEFLNITDCELLDQSIDDYCAFKVPHAWTTHFDQDIVNAGAFTVTFWLRPYASKGGRFKPSVQFFSELSPPDVFLSLFTIGGLSPRVEAYLHQHGKSGGHGIEVGTSFARRDWTHISLVFGSIDYKGHQEVTLMVNAYYMTDYMPTKWVPSHSGKFLEAMVFSPDMLVSPVEFRAEAVPIETLQNHYYDEHEKMSLRRGPLAMEHDRLHHKIEYELAAFSEPGFCGAPPLILQERKEVTVDCPHDSGKYAIEAMYKLAMRSKCGWPFDCGDEVTDDPTALLGCVGKDTPKEHFGRKPHEQKVGHLKGKDVFSEFLPTITGTPFVVRNLQEYGTEDFIDQFTQHVSVDFMMVSPQLGVVSELEISADMTTPVAHVSYHMAHFASLTDDRISGLVALAAVLGFFGLVVIVDALHRLYLKMKNSDHYVGAGEVCVDILIGVLVIVYYVIKAGRAWNSTSAVEHVIERMMLVPWDSSSFTFHQKEEQFFDVMRELEDRISEEQGMRIFFFVILVFTILRCIVLLSSHPRVALLTNTLHDARNELWSLVFLFTFLLVCFGLCGRALFGQKYHEFESLSETLKTEYYLSIGEIPEIFGKEWQITTFVLLFQFIEFFLVLNFLLAIIMDTFTNVQARVDDMEVDQEFFMDLFAVCRVKILRAMHGWPRNEDIIEGLEKMHGLQYVNAERLGGEWDAFGKVGISKHMKKSKWSFKSRVRFCRYYGGGQGIQYEYHRKASIATIDRKIDKLVSDSKKRTKTVKKIKHEMHELIEDMNIAFAKIMDGDYDETTDVFAP